MDVWWYINFKVIGLIVCVQWFQRKHNKLLTMYIYLCVIVFQPINIGAQERQGMMFTTTAWAKYLNGLWFQLSFSNNQYENMTKLTWVKIRIVEENSLKPITIKTICNWLHSYYSQFLSFNIITFSLCIQNCISSLKLFYNIYHLNKLR